MAQGRKTAPASVLRAIRREYLAGATLRSLAARYGYTLGAVRKWASCAVRASPIERATYLQWRAAQQRPKAPRVKRYQRGATHWNAKLSDDDVRLVRALRAGGMPYKQIAEKFETPIGTLADLCHYRSRQHIR